MIGRACANRRAMARFSCEEMTKESEIPVIVGEFSANANLSWGWWDDPLRDHEGSTRKTPNDPAVGSLSARKYARPRTWHEMPFLTMGSADRPRRTCCPGRGWGPQRPGSVRFPERRAADSSVSADYSVFDDSGVLLRHGTEVDTYSMPQVLKNLNAPSPEFGDLRSEVSPMSREKKIAKKRRL